jgi:hypothetical protein
MAVPRDEERRLLEISEKCRAQERAIGDQLLHPRHSMLYPEALRLWDAYQSIRIDCKEKWLAFRAYQEKMREDRRADKRNSAALLQAHSLFIVATHQIPSLRASVGRHEDSQVKNKIAKFLTMVLMILAFRFTTKH